VLFRGSGRAAARATKRFIHTGVVAHFERNTRPHGVGLCRPHWRKIQVTQGGSRTHRHNPGVGNWWLCRRRHKHQLRHAHAVELLHEGIPLPLIQRQLGHSHLSTTGTYLEGINTEEIISTVHARRAPMMHASAGLAL
jgi:hypothetical protein